MKALSVKQPWAWLIVQGIKDVENRTWKTNQRGEILVHAGRKLDPEIEEIREWTWRRHRIEIPDLLPRGGIVGQVKITDCVDKHASPWFRGPYGFTLQSARSLPFLPLPGKLGFFQVQ